MSHRIRSALATIALFFGAFSATHGHAALPASEVPMGQIDTSPRFDATEYFRVRTADSERFHRCSVNHFTQTRESGVADPSRPSGPDNRGFVTTEGVAFWVYGDNGELIPRETLPEPLQRLATHIETHLGVEVDGTVVKFGTPEFGDAFVAFATDQHNLTVKKGAVDP
jgi:hypothetical protein